MKKLMLNGLLMDLLRWYSRKILLYSSSLSISSGFVNNSRWSLLQWIFKHLLHDGGLHRFLDILHVLVDLLVGVRCLLLFLIRVNGNSLTISFRVVELLGRDSARGRSALPAELLVLALELLHLGL